ncbi:MAG: anti-sigma factor family protein [Blastocatellia bacterium]
MKIIEFEQKDCARIRPYLDSYVNNELLVETNHEVLKHLGSCDTCSQVLRTKVRVKDLLRGAVQRQAVPAELQKRIQTRIRRSPVTDWSRMSFAIAACVALLAVGAGVTRVWKGRQASRAAQTQRLDGLLSIGLDDHIHCALDEGSAWKHYSPEEMTQKLGPDYAGLAPVVRANIPAGFEVVVAHRCLVDNRKFVHLILRKDDKVISVSITKKSGDSFNGLPSAANAAGLALYQSNLAGSAVSAFETTDYLIFIVSNLPQDRNLTIAENLVTPVSGFLASSKA